MEKTLLTIGVSSIILMLILGPVKFLALDRFTSATWYPRYRKIMQIVMLALSAICFLSFGAVLVLYLKSEITDPVEYFKSIIQ